ncbi:DnaD domain protein [Clostridium botulinum]|nr:DnaD domain protein [Clostridium botulinum]
MAGEGKGWISLYRSIQDHWLWQEKPFSKGQAWMDLLLSANHQDKKVLLGNELITVIRGSFITSQKKLMERWGWGSEKTRKFLKLLDDDRMIKFQPDKKKTTITIINYESYQNQNGCSTDKSMDIEKPQNYNRMITECNQNDNRIQSETNNNDNNVNNDNKYINNKEEVSPIEVYQNNIYPMPGVIEIEGINSWSNDLGNELVVYAINIAAKSNVRKWNFIEKILIDWDKNGIKTLNQAKAYSQNRRKGGQKENDRDRTDNTKDEVKYDFSRFGG